MRKAFGLTVLVAGLLVGPLMVSQSKSQSPAGSTASAAALPGGTSAAAGNLVFSAQTLGGRTQIVILDTANRSLATYSVEAETGMIELKSVRNIDADLRLKEFNGTKPSPDEVRAVLQP